MIFSIARILSKFRQFMHPLSGMILTVMTMAWIGFAVKENFAPFLMTHPEILDHMFTMEPAQKQHMIEQFDEQKLCDRAIHYFSNDEIYLENHKIYYQHPLRKVLYQIQIHSDFIEFDEQDGNPFLPFLQRIYRRFVVRDGKESMKSL